MAPVLTRLLFLLLVLSVAACSAGSVGSLDGAPDISDAAMDTGPDSAQDGGADTGTDAGADARSDAGTDAGSDAGSDAGGDAGPHDFLWGEDPPSTLLPPNTTDLAFTVHSTLPASCTFSIGTDVPYPGTTAFDQGQGTLDHGVTLRPLDPDTKVVNEVYVRCDAQPDFVLHLRYRSLPDARPSFPRKGNLWGWWGLVPKGLDYCARIDLYLGADFAPADSVQLRQLNPNVLILTSVNTVERNGDEVVPDAYWLKDVNGNRIEVWNNAYRINLTKPEVAEWQARYAYQKILDLGLMVDGCFFDNFFTSQSWVTQDMWGHPVQIDADNDRVADDPAALDAAWRAGVFHELETWRQLMPHALASGHLPRPPSADIGAIFNGDSIGFMAPEVADGRIGFAELWDTYQGWWTEGRPPVITMIEGAPPYQISYGYGYQPLGDMPAATLEFARTYYPYMRFGLAVALMNDGYYAYEFGDTYHGNDWWYDEFDFDLGQPLGMAQRVPVGGTDPTDHVDNGGFENPLAGTWGSWVNTAVGAAATFVQDTSQAAVGTASARADITNAGQGIDWHIILYQTDRSVQAGVSYDLVFQAKAASAHPISVNLQKQAADWHSYGLYQAFTLDTQWRQYTATFEATDTASDGRLSFQVGSQVGTVWIDDVHLVEHPADVFTRAFEHGLAVLNGSRQGQTIAVGPGYSRIQGTQAPLYEFILDDAGPAFSFTGSWVAATYDSGMWVAASPWFHTWGPGCHRLDDTQGEAQVGLQPPSDDTYSIAVWWPAAPEAATWSQAVVFEVVTGGVVVASATLDQTQNGDQWNPVAEVPLTRAGSSFLRIRNLGSGPAIADAVYLRSAARFNDGSAALSVTLQPMDGIVLRKN